MKYIKLYEDFICEKEMISINSTSEGDKVEVEGQSVTITKFISCTNDDKKICTSFEGRLNSDNSLVIIQYINNKYIITTEDPSKKAFTGRVPNTTDYSHY